MLRGSTPKALIRVGEMKLALTPLSTKEEDFRVVFDIRLDSEISAESE